MLEDFSSDDFRFYNYKFIRSHSFKTENRYTPQHYIAYLKEGSVKIIKDSEVFNFKKGDVFYIPKSIRYESYWQSEHIINYISLGFKHFPNFSGSKYSLQLIDCSDEEKLMLSEINTSCPPDCYSVGKLYCFIGTVLNRMQTVKKNKRNYIFEQAINYMKNNTLYNVSDVASFCKISNSELFLIFKEFAHETPNDVKNQILCKRAEIQLITTDYSIEKISSDLGFSSSSYFRKILKKYLNKTPKEIRKSQFLQ